MSDIEPSKPREYYPDKAEQTEMGGSLISGFGGVEDIGRRPIMEDKHIAIEAFRNRPDESFFAIYDGYEVKGGEIARENLHLIFKKELEKGIDAREAIERAFEIVDKKIESTDSLAGTTAAVVYLKGKKCLVANVGDSRVLLDRKGKAERLSYDHKPGDPAEKERIEDAGGRVTEGYKVREGRVSPARIGNLAISRALGAGELGELVSAEAHITEFDLKRGDRRMMLASDGLWDAIEDQEAVDMIDKFKYPNMASSFLITEAKKRGSTDNITVIVVDFKRIPVE